jgi:hypothetical protein
MAKTTYEKDYQRAFSATATFFRRLCELIVAHKEQPKFKIWLSDSSTVENLVLDELLAFPNSSNRQIKRIELETGYASSLRVSVDLRTQDHFAPISYRVVGNDKDSTYVSSEIDKLLTTIIRSQAYSYFAAMPTQHRALWWSVLQIVGGMGLGVGFAQGSLPLMLLGVFFTLISLVYGRLARALMPQGHFEIGDGIERAGQIAARRVKFLSFILSGIVIALAVNIGSSYLYDRYLK